ncbi:MAG: hypothetical protein IH972_04830 [Candidatus Marinimicrobia bacterium]|nr:hypothetical protein [Candidatus Neomarinimicrobiota bacterium]
MKVLLHQDLLYLIALYDAVDSRLNQVRPQPDSKQLGLLGGNTHTLEIKDRQGWLAYRWRNLNGRRCFGYGRRRDLNSRRRFGYDRRRYLNKRRCFGYGRRRYRRLFFKEERLVGAVVIGKWSGSSRSRMMDLVKKQGRVRDRQALLDL